MGSVVVLSLFVFAFLSYANAIDSLRFLVLGDMGGMPLEPYSTYVERSTAKEMGKLADLYEPKFIMEVGDNFYFDGVKDLSDIRFNMTFEDVYTANSLQVPWYIIAGNHDHNGNVSAQIAYSKVSQRWNFPDYYYYIEQSIPGGKTVGFVMIDTITLCGNTHDHIYEQPTGPKDTLKANQQWNFIIDVLNKSNADYLFTVGHYPVYSIAEHGPTKCLVDGLLPLIHKFNVNGHISGHEHNLQHLRINSSNPRARNIDFFISGMANFIDSNKDHENSVPSGSSKFHYSNILSLGGFLMVEAVPSNMTFTFVDAFGKRLYSSVVDPRT